MRPKGHGSGPRDAPRCQRMAHCPFYRNLDDLIFTALNEEKRESRKGSGREMKGGETNTAFPRRFRVPAQVRITPHVHHFGGFDRTHMKLRRTRLFSKHNVVPKTEVKKNKICILEEKEPSNFPVIFGPK